MSQHSWYNPNRRHYGPKPNTRKARGLPRRDKGKTHCVASTNTEIYSGLERVDVDTNVEEVALPKKVSVMKRYAKMYNWYVQYYQRFFDKKVCIQLVAKKFRSTEATVTKAIKVCKYILATANEND